MGVQMGGFSFGSARRIGDPGTAGSAGTSHLIRSAEKLASSGRYEFALEQLAVAQRLDPENKYIQAIIDRIRSAEKEGTSNQPQGPNKLTVSVGPKFKEGIRSQVDDEPVSPEAVATQVRALTQKAEQYLDKGRSDMAFASLMKAYLLDPLSPYVIASEKAVLPAWESAKITGRASLASSFEENLDSMFNNGTSTMSFQNPYGQNSSPVSPEEQLRMEMLKQKKEQERLDRERAVWREASKPPKIFGDEVTEKTPPPLPTSENSEQKPRTSGLFSKLKLGKFLE